MKLKKARNEIIVFAVLLAFFAVLYFVITPINVPIKIISGSESFTQQTFPNLLTISMAACAVLGLINAVINYMNLKKEAGGVVESAETTKQDWIVTLIPYITFAAILLYVVLFDMIGFLLATLIMAPVLLFTFKARKWYFLVITYVFSFGMYLLFKLVLLVPLP